MTNGFLYVCSGDPYLHEAQVSVKSLRAVMPDANIAIMTDTCNPGKEFDYIFEIEDPQYGSAYKIPNLEKTPFDNTVFLDTDTYLTKPVPELFEILKSFELAAAHDPGRDFFYPELPVPRLFPEYNTGVVAYKLTDRVNCLLNLWQDVYNSHVKNGVTADQPSFRKAAYDLGIDIHTLPPEYNCRTSKAGYLNGAAKVLHGRHNRDLSEIAKKVNDVPARRVHSSIETDIGVFSPPKATPLRWLWFSLASNGVYETMRIMKRELLNR